jgi:hypothetical protein
MGRPKRERCDFVDALRAFEIRAPIKNAIWEVNIPGVLSECRVCAGRMRCYQRIDGETVFNRGEPLREVIRIR